MMPRPQASWRTARERVLPRRIDQPEVAARFRADSAAMVLCEDWDAGQLVYELRLYSSGKYRVLQVLPWEAGAGLDR
jgi:hypothetical protein